LFLDQYIEEYYSFKIVELINIEEYLTNGGFESSKFNSKSTALYFLEQDTKLVIRISNHEKLTVAFADKHETPDYNYVIKVYEGGYALQKDIDKVINSPREA